MPMLRRKSGSPGARALSLSRRPNEGEQLTTSSRGPVLNVEEGTAEEKPGSTARGGHLARGEMEQKQVYFEAHHSPEVELPHGTTVVEHNQAQKSRPSRQSSPKSAARASCRSWASQQTKTLQHTLVLTTRQMADHERKSASSWEETLREFNCCDPEGEKRSAEQQEKKVNTHPVPGCWQTFSVDPEGLETQVSEPKHVRSSFSTTSIDEEHGKENDNGCPSGQGDRSAADGNLQKTNVVVRQEEREGAARTSSSTLEEDAPVVQSFRTTLVTSSAACQNALEEDPSIGETNRSKNNGEEELDAPTSEPSRTEIEAVNDVLDTAAAIAASAIASTTKPAREEKAPSSELLPPVWAAKITEAEIDEFLRWREQRSKANTTCFGSSTDSENTKMGVVAEKADLEAENSSSDSFPHHEVKAQLENSERAPSENNGSHSDKLPPETPSSSSEEDIELARQGENHNATLVGDHEKDLLLVERPALEITFTSSGESLPSFHIGREEGTSSSSKETSSTGGEDDSNYGQNANTSGVSETDEHHSHHHAHSHSSSAHFVEKIKRKVLKIRADVLVDTIKVDLTGNSEFALVYATLESTGKTEMIYAVRKT
ncbi:unnamed protein product [Amoebophrya sp. A25]|nr:unnamed protein product [Amoebophrya sp. A25]|eukprot:GSA25T00004641001.1